MSREEAIESLRGILTEAVEFENSVCYVTEEDREPLEMAIKALEQEPSEDAVSREEVKEQMLKYGFRAPDMTVTEFVEDLPSVNPQPCEDTISRADAEALFRNARSKLNPSDYKTADEFNTRDLMLLNAEQFIHLLPSVRPQEPKTGHWIFDEILDKHYYCSECKSMGVDYWDYCPYCGAKMIEPQESEVSDADSN